MSAGAGAEAGTPAADGTGAAAGGGADAGVVTASAAVERGARAGAGSSARGSELERTTITATTPHAKATLPSNHGSARIRRGLRAEDGRRGSGTGSS
ncbi:MAG TPA: hypothetical protein VNN72_25175, partial [Polyangiaceae bacterium]|nr:hypothetical protein [Polyangiaceae bacterium]